MATCPLCRKRPAKRSCPALRQTICAVCCATKRQVEIACPADCAFLTSAQRHPAAAVKRRFEDDIASLMASLGRLTEPQLQTFFLLQTVVVRHEPGGLARLLDADVALAAGALAASLETASRGLIYEESTASIVAEGLRRALRPVLDEIVKGGGSRAERDAAAVLRGIERGARQAVAQGGDGSMSYLDLVGRVLQERRPAEAPGPGLIVTP